MRIARAKQNKIKWLTFFVVFSLSLMIGGFYGSTQTASAAPDAQATNQGMAYAGSQACIQCHGAIHDVWVATRHALAFSAPIFQQDWNEVGKQTSCLECHTTGYDEDTGSYAEEGVSCEACHGPFQTDHPAKLMPITPDEELCGTCHTSTTNEWMASPHREPNVTCQACHNPHSQTPKAESVTALCGNCHKERGDSFTHSTHAGAGLECSNCHMYTSPRTEDAIMGLVPTGHTFTVGSEACIGCHQDTVHTRDEILKLSGEVEELTTVDTETLEQKVTQQEEEITRLESTSSVRLYVGLAQGAIIGLITGGVAAWVISRGIKVIEVEEDE
jgi:nitrate/TMAO reductase-like tetraheme cytochrome c subunit